MASVNRRWLPPALIAAAGVASVVAYGRLPATIILRLEGLLPFTAANTSSPTPRWVTLSLMPALALVMWAAFRLAATTVGQRLGRRMFRQYRRVRLFHRQGRQAATQDWLEGGGYVGGLGDHGCALFDQCVGALAARVER